MLAGKFSQRHWEGQTETLGGIPFNPRRAPQQRLAVTVGEQALNYNRIMIGAVTITAPCRIAAELGGSRMIHFISASL